MSSAASGGNASAEPTTTAAERAEAAAMRSASGSTQANPQSRSLPPRAVIHEHARQKYVLVAVSQASGSPLYFVRGDKHAGYHKDAARPLLQELSRLSLPYEVLGGGRIEHADSKGVSQIRIYGFSYGFPWKDGVSLHHVTADILREEYPGFDVTFSDEGN